MIQQLQLQEKKELIEINVVIIICVKEKDATGLMYYGARNYNPEQGQFIEPDKELPNVYDPQQLNRYAYARNNPYKYVDKEGKVIAPVVVGIGIYIVGRGILGAAEASISDITTQISSKENINYGRIGVQAIKGFGKGIAIGGTEVGIIGASILANSPTIGVSLARLVGEEIINPAWDISYKEKNVDTKTTNIPEQRIKETTKPSSNLPLKSRNEILATIRQFQSLNQRSESAQQAYKQYIQTLLSSESTPNTESTSTQTQSKKAGGQG